MAAIGFLVVLVALVLRGIRKHGHDDKSGADSGSAWDDNSPGD